MTYLDGEMGLINGDVCPYFIIPPPRPSPPSIIILRLGLETIKVPEPAPAAKELWGDLRDDPSRWRCEKVCEDVRNGVREGA